MFNLIYSPQILGSLLCNVLSSSISSSSSSNSREDNDSIKETSTLIEKMIKSWVVEW